jgi:succinyl-diaminopimelate desuccinylase
MPERAHAADANASLDLARRLIACPSITPDDAGCLGLVAARLTAAGFSCERLDRGKVGNLWARHGVTAPIICLAGHVDVVPPGPIDRWTSDPFVPTERDGHLYGRGVADMKASVAAMVTAAERFVTAHPDHGGSIAMLLTSDEEGDAVDGTAAVVDVLRSRGDVLAACIIGEPTSTSQLGDAMKNGRRGSLHGALTVKGVQGHVAYPEHARNPIHLAVPALAELVTAEWDRGDESFAPTSFQISNVHAGAGANNVIPGTLQAVFNFRFSPASLPEALKARVHAMLDRHDVEYDLAWTLQSVPFISPRGRLVDALSAAVREVAGITPALSTGGGTSDGRFLAAISTELVEFGPINATIHAIDERIRVADIAPLSRIYERTIAALIG